MTNIQDNRQKEIRRRFVYYYGWNIVAVCILSQMSALGLALNCLSLFVSDWSREFGVPVSNFSLGVTLFSLFGSVMPIIGGWVADRFPARWVIGLGLLGIALADCLVGSASAGWQIVAIYAALLPILITISAAVPAQTVVSRWFVRRRGLAMGLNAFGLAAAGVLFPPIILTLLPLIGWRGAWWVFGSVIGAVVMPLVVLTLRDRPTLKEGEHYIPTISTEQTASKVRISDIIKRKRFWIIIAAFLPIQCISMTMNVNLGILVTSRGHTLTLAGALLSAYSIFALTGKLASGLLADRFGNRLPFAAVCLLAAAGIATLGTAHDAPLLFTAVMLMGLSQGHWTLFAAATAAEFGPGSFGRAFGVACAFTNIGSFAPTAVAWTYERVGSYQTPLFALSGLAVLGACAAMLLRERSARLSPIVA